MKKLISTSIFSIVLVLLVLASSSCAPKNPISAGFSNPGTAPCNGAIRLPFTALHSKQQPITITSFAAVATGPNADCATVTLMSDNDARPDVIDLAVSVTCDCTPGQFITVVVTVKDQNGNVMDAWTTVTT